MKLTKQEIDKIVEKKYEQWVKNASKFTSEAADVIGEIVLRFYERGLDIDKIKNIDCYVNCTAKYQVWGKNSEYYRLNERHKFYEDNTIDFEKIENDFYIIDEYEFPDYDKLISELRNSNFSWCEQEIFLRKILENKTFKEIGFDFNLKISQVFYTYNKVKKYLQNKFENYGEE